ncbi:MAG: phosphoribosylaminoimidazolesuccinocarboxamide synthase [Candidatus Omnitrophica bacterium]|nr:phosphoribosylaminoimidazolesuccinocarboxamide synthase [Candidatus Omnitrophota bacterium]
MNDTVLTTDFSDLKLFRRGKVRDVYDLGDSLLIISTDRISAFDVVLPSAIPYKGAVLTQLSKFWFSLLGDTVANHVITTDITEFPASLRAYDSFLADRSMIVKKAKPFPVECVVRGYLSGSGWKEYKQKQSICGIALPKGLRESEILAEPIFTPSTKADVGHDMNVDQGYVEKTVGRQVAETLKRLSLAIYKKAHAYALGKGIIIADTKFEFGLYDDAIILIDEVLTPDSSRFWPLDRYIVGSAQPSFDKQFVRDYLESLPWDKNPPAPELPEEIIRKTSEKYLDAYEKLTGQQFA